MSQENVEVVRRYLAVATRRLAGYWDQPRSVAEAMEAGELDPDSAEMLGQMCEDVRWTNAMGDTYQGKLACAKGVDELLGASNAYSVSVERVSAVDSEHVLASLR